MGVFTHNDICVPYCQNICVMGQGRDQNDSGKQIEISFSKWGEKNHNCGIKSPLNII